MSITVTTRLKRVGSGGHTSRPRWTRHVVWAGDASRAACGVVTVLGLDSTIESPAVQGLIHNCKRCQSLSADWLWKDKIVRDC